MSMEWTGKAGMPNRVSITRECRAAGAQLGVRTRGPRASAEPVCPSPGGCHQFSIRWRLGGSFGLQTSLLMKALALPETALSQGGHQIRLPCRGTSRLQFGAIGLPPAGLGISLGSGWGGGAPFQSSSGTEGRGVAVREFLPQELSLTALGLPSGRASRN